MISNLILLLVLVIIYVWWWVMEKYSYFRNRNMQYEKPNFPFGNVKDIGRTTDGHTWINRLYLKFRNADVLGGIFIGTEPTIVITDIDVIQDILIRDFSKFNDNGYYMNEDQDPLSCNLFSLHGERWRTLRTKISPTFSQCKIRTMFPTVNMVGQDLIAFVNRFASERQPFNVKNVSMRYICDTIGSCAFGLDCKALTDEDPFMLKVAARLFVPSQLEMMYWLFTNTYQKLSKTLRLKVFPTDVTNYFKRMINETVDFRERNNVQRNDFMNLLIQIKNIGCLIEDESGENIGSITKDQLTAQAFLIFFVGFHTSRTVLTFALFELASHQEIQQKARQEIRSKMIDDEITFDALNQMTYLQQIVDEALRKYPPNGMLQRRANTDYKVRNSDHIIEKGVNVYIPIYGIHYDPEFYPDPERFDPDRMTKENMEKRHPSTFMPFGSGPRICIGQRFGYLQVKLALALLLSKFKFTVNSKTKQPLVYDPLAYEIDVADGIWLDSLAI